VLDLLLPTTDGGVGVQLIIWAVVSAIGLFATRSKKDLRLLVIGLSILTLGVMGIRAIH
jgi:hypothetical protein